MYQPLRWALQDLRRLLRLDDTAREKYIVDPTRHFTRQRTLTFARTAVLVLGLLKKV